MSPEPTPKGERLLGLDAVRGLALLGILAVNAPHFAAPLYQAYYPSLWPFPPSETSLWVWGLTHTLFTSKFISLFSMLFGVSVFLVGGDGTDPERERILVRRLSWLALFGLLHGLLIWYGDVLLTYAVGGFIVAQMRRWPAGRLLAVGGAAYAAYLLMTAAGAGLPEGQLRFDPYYAHQAGYAGGFFDSLWANIVDWMMMGLPASLMAIIFCTPLMIIGLGLFKAGFLAGKGSGRQHIAAASAGSAAIVITALFAGRQIATGFSPGAEAWGDLALYVLAPLAALAYAAVVLTSASRRGWLARVLAPVGQMAFTNYIAQSVIMSILFYGGRGPGWFGEVDRPGLAVIVGAVWLFQIAASNLWLRVFAMGPLEWLWRRLSYGRAIPLKA